MGSNAENTYKQLHLHRRGVHTVCWYLIYNGNDNNSDKNEDGNDEPCKAWRNWLGKLRSLFYIHMTYCSLQWWREYTNRSMYNNELIRLVWGSCVKCLNCTFVSVFRFCCFVVVVVLYVYFLVMTHGSLFIWSNESELIVVIENAIQYKLQFYKCSLRFGNTFKAHTQTHSRIFSDIRAPRSNRWWRFLSTSDTQNKRTPT